MVSVPLVEYSFQPTQAILTLVWDLKDDGTKDLEPKKKNAVLAINLKYALLQFVTWFLLPVMSKQMFLQCTCLCECFETLGALLGFLPCVNHLMDPKVIDLFGRIVTQWTTVSVGEQMVFQISGEEDENSQLTYLWGLSPVWLIMCVFRLLDSLQVYKHTLQLRCFKSVWVSKCDLSPLLLVDELSHKVKL